MAEVDNITKGAASIARDAAYVAVGAGVLGVQRAQVRRRALQRRLHAGELDEVLVGVRANLTRGVRRVDDAIEHIESSLEPLEHQLPPPVRKLVGLAHLQVRQVRGKLRHRIEPSA